jgi:membrane-associated phospholipid phosphatase
VAAHARVPGLAPSARWSSLTLGESGGVHARGGGGQSALSSPATADGAPTGRVLPLVATATLVMLLLALAGSVSGGWLTSVDQQAVDDLMVGVRPNQQSSSSWSSALPIFRPDLHRGHLVVGALTYAVTFPASLVPAALLVGVSLLLIYRRDGNRGHLVAFACAFLAASLAELAGKALVTRPSLYSSSPPAPPIRLDTFDATFPSGHVTRAFLVAAALGTCLPRIRGLFYVWVGAVAASLVIAGAHTPSDVVGGLLLGFVCVRALKSRSEIATAATLALSSARRASRRVCEFFQRSPPK